MNKKYAALFLRKDSAYKERPYWDCFDEERNAFTFDGSMPCVVHAPCRKWGVLSHMAFNARPGEKGMALWGAEMIRSCGGIFEHPSGSRIFKEYLPDAGSETDKYGGFTILIDQYDFGHVAHKATKLYICGIEKSSLPSMPPKRLEPTNRSICGNVPGTTRCTGYQREYTPYGLMNWFEAVLDKIILHH